MADIHSLNQWDTHKLPVGMSRRYEFSSYEETRQFLDDLAHLSGRTGYYPSLNFNRTQVTVRIEAEAKELGMMEYGFAAETDAILSHKALAA
ncbi:4a-hydroxytetrahydrobiopterin dehydratase [Thiothrix litoralis]|jgi:pterin-4a-carbinolamine dehydratase|uniref:4a-hydroxytetrahydrobiopterin dehydratase n=1 Tax=Thiothrix litoralis TaxID=2891210 RepID=A0ABX7WQQ1_9GAMM|nr:4a-hydroxytetrahydrobiopterin dehydratase [Thiothrix litoralis]QTR45772.1 4a-hydroxytetrahydrobiopterin dehydratase [Thiothrix litoralis]